MAVNFGGYTDAEIERWLWLRAVEWCGFPGYVSQLFAPVLCIFYPWPEVLFGVIGCGIVWSLVRYWFVSPTISDKVCLLVVWFKWPVSIGSSIYLFVHGQTVSGVVALTWPLFAGFLTVPGKIGVIEVRLAKRIGYVSVDA